MMKPMGSQDAGPQLINNPTNAQDPEEVPVVVDTKDISPQKNPILYNGCKV